MSEPVRPPRSLKWKRRLGMVGRSLPRSFPRRVILIYHSVGGGELSLPVERFSEQLVWLAEHADVVTLDRLLESSSPSRLQVALTFDDGYATLAGPVARLLAENKWSATVYLNTGHVGDDRREPSRPDLGHYPAEHFLLWREVAELEYLGWIIGSHGVEHVDLTGIDPAATAGQLAVSRQVIEARLRHPCRHFAYTWGRHDARVRKQVTASGYSFAVAAHHGAVSSSSDAMALPRIDVRREYSLDDFAAVVRGDWDYLGLYQNLKRVLR